MAAAPAPEQAIFHVADVLADQLEAIEDGAAVIAVPC